MKPRKTLIGLIAAMLLAFGVAEADAGALMCKTRNGDVQHKDSDGNICGAVADGSKSEAKAKGLKSYAWATSESRGRARAIATRGGNAQSGAYGNSGKCKASAIALGDGSIAFAQCEAGGRVQATATGGGGAYGFDNKAPICVPGSGTATVHSTFGDCP